MTCFHAATGFSVLVAETGQDVFSCDPALRPRVPVIMGAKPGQTYTVRIQATRIRDGYLRADGQIRTMRVHVPAVNSAYWRTHP